MEEIDLKDLFTLFWEKRNLIITIVLIFIILGLIYTMFLVTPKYTSTTKLVLVSGNEATNTITSSDLSINSNLVSTYREIVTSDSVLDRVIQNLNLTDVTVEELKSSLNIGDVDGVIANANKVTSALGKEVQFNNFDEFDDLMNSDETLRM